MSRTLRPRDHYATTHLYLAPDDRTGRSRFRLPQTMVTQLHSEYKAILDTATFASLALTSGPCASSTISVVPTVLAASAGLQRRDDAIKFV